MNLEHIFIFVICIISSTGDNSQDYLCPLFSSYISTNFLDPLVFFLREIGAAVLISNGRLLACWDSVKASIEADDLLQNTVKNC